MDTGKPVERRYLIYRGTGRGGRPVEVHLITAAAEATAADAWTRLARLDPTVDPRSVEIETRSLPARPAAAGRPHAGRRAAAPIDLARWVARRAALAHDAR